MDNATPFTVRWEYTADGIKRSRLIEADQINVAYDETLRDINNSPCAMLGIYIAPPTGVVVIGNPENGAESMALTFGKVYVMNREGKTVSTYTLANPGGAVVNAIESAGMLEPARELQEPKTLAHLAQEAGLRQKSHY